MNAEALAGFVPKAPEEPFGSLFLLIYQAKIFAGQLSLINVYICWYIFKNKNTNII